MSVQLLFEGCVLVAIITATIYQEWANKYVTGTELTSLEAICAQVSDAIKARLKRVVEQTSFTNLIFNAPTTPVVVLSRYRPVVISTFQCYYNYQSYGDPASFGSNDLLTMYSDYILEPEPEDPLLSTGLLTSLQGYWGLGFYSPPMQLALRKTPTPGAMKINLTGGFEVIPQGIIEAACLAVSRIMGMRRYGVRPSFEAWNGYSYTISANSVNGILGSPDILGLLEPYINYAEIFG